MVGLKALLFDVDGTLADTEKDGHRVAFNRAFRQAGLDWEWSESLYGQLLEVTGGKERIRYYLDAFAQSFRRPQDLDGFIAELHEKKTYYYLELLKRGAVPLRPGVRRLLTQARESGLRLAIATTTTASNVSALLRHGLTEDAENWFDVIAAGDVVPAKKPAPDIYLWAMQELGLMPEDCMAFEDSEQGVRAVLASGLKALVVTVNDYTRDHNLSGSTVVLDHLGDFGNPCRVLKGDLQGAPMLGVPELRRLHSRIYGTENSNL